MFNKLRINKKMTFIDFLSGTPARSYIFQNEAYDVQIQRAARMIEDAEYILLGAGSGLSTAAGVCYGGDFFKENFSEFIELYGENGYMADMYSAGFYPYPSEEAKWGYWSKHALLGGVDLEPLPLYKKLLELLKDKNYFVLTTNVDEQFYKSGFDRKRIFSTQGSYEKIQCRRGCHPKTYHGTEMFHQMDQARKKCLIPSYMVPRCPVCGGPMEMNLRSDQYFVQDENWYAEQKNFGDFLSEALNSGKNVLTMCLGTGFNTPTIIRFPFEKLVRENSNVSLLRLNRNEAVVEEGCQDREVGINADMARSIADILQKVNEGGKQS